MKDVQKEFYEALYDTNESDIANVEYAALVGGIILGKQGFLLSRIHRVQQGGIELWLVQRAWWHDDHKCQIMVGASPAMRNCFRSCK